MNEPRSNRDAPPRTEATSRWERPLLTFVGDLKDLVRGEGKLSGTHDMDSTNMRLEKGQGG